MKTSMTILMLLLALVVSAQVQWQSLDDGLTLGKYDSPVKSQIGNSQFTILKVDPKQYELTILCENQYVGERSVKGWCEDFSKVAAINAGMYMEDGRNCGLQVTDGFTNGKLNSFNTILAFDCTNPDLPDVQIIDRQCQDFEYLRTQYRSMTQGIRMVDIYQNNCWTVQDKMWSTSAVAMDIAGNVLLIHCRSPYPVHTFVDILLDSGVGIYNMMYLEGGAVAELYVQVGDVAFSSIGSYESGYNPNDNNRVLWTIPNVIAVGKR